MLLQIKKRMPNLLTKVSRKNNPFLSMDIETVNKVANSVFITEYRKNKNKKVYQEIIEKMMLEEGNCDASFKPFFKELKELIETKSNPYQKRYNILLLLDKDRKLLRKAKIYANADIPKMEHIHNMLEILRDYVKYGEVEQKKYGEVMTPLKTVKDMLSEIPSKVWKDRNLKKMKFLDPANGTGPYLAMLVDRLMKALKNDEEIGGDTPEQQNIRYKYILENMIYACEIQPKNMFLWMMAIDPHGHYTLNIHPGSYLDEDFDITMKEVWGVKKFDYIIGNPPYQEMDGGNGASAKPIYNRFVEKSISICDNLLFITPSRWFAGGKGLDAYRKKMLNSNKLVLLNHFDDASSIFGSSVEIKGGVSYFLYDNNYNGLCKFNGENVDLSSNEIVVHPKNYPLLEKINKHESIADICSLSMYFGVDYREGRGTRIKDTKIDDNYIKCYVSQPKGFTKWIDKSYLTGKDISKYRVVTPRAATKGGEGLGNIFIMNPDECSSDTYLTFPVETLEQAKSLMSYMKTNFFNYFLALRKISQDIKSDTFKWVPSVPFDKMWNDEQLFDYFEFTEDEKNLIKKFNQN